LTSSKVPYTAGVLVKGLVRQVAKTAVANGQGPAPYGPMRRSCYQTAGSAQHIWQAGIYIWPTQ